MLSETGFHWLGDYEITADEVLGGIAPKANKLEQAKQMLRELAETTNMVQSNEIFEMADKQLSLIHIWYFANIKKEIHMKCREGIEKLGRIFLKQLKGSCRKRLGLSNLR